MIGHDVKKRAQHFLENKTKIHLRLNSGRFYNGHIIEIKKDLFIFDDVKLGELPIWFSQIKEDRMEPFREVGA